MNNKKKAQGLIEYALILSLVAVVSIVVLQTLGKPINRVSVGASGTVEERSLTNAREYCTRIGGTWSGADKHCAVP